MSLFQFLKSKTFFLQIAIAIVCLLLLVFGLKFWLGVTTNHNQKIQVPNLQKLTLVEVERTLKELDLESYKLIAIDNPHRIMRALEVCIGSGIPYSTFKNKPKKQRNPGKTNKQSKPSIPRKEKQTMRVMQAKQATQAGG